MVTIHTFLPIATAKNWELHQMDVHNAFLHCDLKEEVYMKVPPGFSRGRPGESLPDYSLFTWSNKNVQKNVLVYVDDLILYGKNSVALLSFKEYLSSCFHMKDLGILKYFLGIEVVRSQEVIFLSQRKYTLNIISEAGLLGAKPATFPLEQNHHLASSTSHLLIDIERYRRVVGPLLYLSFTRPDLSFVVQITVARSSVEAEYRSMGAVTYELKWLKGLLHSLGISYSRPMRLQCDSRSALHLAQNPVFHERTKHIKVDCHFLRDAILDGLIATSHVSTSEQLADIFIKALGKDQFEYLLRKLGIHNPHAPT
ncbi:transmembrane signal receptor [Lithospermum erythrorhizon]|uniref:Transmembrane signal receptor n=1 Tax=Lithospermum erythrorhizon TaxID=34254 RepID=A0AAV3R835_LITER